MADLGAIRIAKLANDEPDAKRIKLLPSDLLAAQMLNSMGASGVEIIPLEKLATVQYYGNMNVPHFTELCDEHPANKGIAISRLSEVQLKTGERLSLPVYKKLIDAALYKEAMAEFTMLKPHFTTLVGKHTCSVDSGDAVATIVYSC